jgi:hypothetical protein
MANSEISINDKLADVFRTINTDWRLFDQVSSENTEGLSKKKALRPDILITDTSLAYQSRPTDQLRRLRSQSSSFSTLENSLLRRVRRPTVSTV